MQYLFYSQCPILSTAGSAGEATFWHTRNKSQHIPDKETAHYWWHGSCAQFLSMDSARGNSAQPPQMYLKLGNHVDDVLEKHEILMPVRRIISNKGYNNKSDNDLAILQMQSPVTFTNYVNAVRLPTQDFPTNNNTCVAIGWGRFADNSAQAINLQQTIMPIISYSSCDQEWFGLNTQKTGRICASSASLNENSSICQGDSGGPILCQETVGKTKPFTIYGLSSQVDALSCLRKPGIFMRIFAYTTWITQVAQNVNEYPDQQHTKV
uniref:Peptidase S1 domain-containing protein n=1 Tax=Romanomermis culicivorax TaxID=13658 RepID=A0A915L0G3_ROMCU